MNRHQLAVTVTFLACVMCGILFARPANANTPQTVGAFMAYGGTGVSEDFCLTADVWDDSSITVTGCYEPDFSGYEQQWQLYSDGTIHLNIGGSDYGCLDVYGNDPAGGVVDLNNESTYSCHDNDADIWWLDRYGELVNYANGYYCLTANSDSANATVSISACTGGSSGNLSQIWLPLEYTFTLANSQIGSESCLDVTYNDQSTGTPLDDTSCNGTTAQWFTFRPVPSPTSAPFQAELWSQSSAGSNNCMVDANVNNCGGAYGYSGCLASCSSNTVTAPSEQFNFQGPMLFHSLTAYTSQLGSALEYGTDDYCFAYDGSGETALPSPWSISLYLTQSSGITCYDGASSTQEWSIQLQAPGFNWDW